MIKFLSPSQRVSANSSSLHLC